MAAGPVEVVEDTQKLGDHRRLGALTNQLLVAQCPLAVIGELGWDPLQVLGQFGDFVGTFGGGRSRHRPTRGRAGSLLRLFRSSRARANFAGFGVDTPFVGDSHRLVRIV